MSKLYATPADMALQNRICPFTSPECAPLSYKIDGVAYRGIPKFFRPTVTRQQIDANITQYILRGVHMSGLAVTATVQMYRDFPVVDWVASFENTTDHPSPIVSDICIVDTVIEGSSPILIHNNGDNCNETGYTITYTALDGGTAVSKAPKGGTPCCDDGPYMRLQYEDFGVNIGIGWTGGWSAQFTGTADGAAVSIGQARCHMTILPGEVMRTPRVTMQAYAGDEARGRNLWRKFYFKHILPRENGEPIPPKLCLHVWNVGGPEFTGATEEQQLTGLQTYIDCGMKPDIWWFDAGWYPCNFDWPLTGTWRHDPERFPRGLGPLGQACEDNGVQLLLWFEPERVREGTELWNEHPEWLLKNDSGQALLNLGDTACCDWLIGHVNGLIKAYHIHLYRQDFNFNPAPYWELHETDDRIGALENLHVQGYLRYWDALIDANPGLWIDSCASGGRRNDLDTMRRAVPLHYTDVGYGNHPIKQKQHRLMFEWIPYFRAHNMSWDNDEGLYINGGKPVDAFAFHCALAPSLTNMTTFDGPDSEYECAAVMLPIWRRAAEIELRADYYPLTACNASPEDWYAMQFDDPEVGDGFVQLIRNTRVDDDTFDLHMIVHNPEDIYFFENMENGDIMQLTGEQLMAGIPLSLAKREGVVWFYHIVTL
ncbi:MAG: alpha-galactosidase [Clostridia bacterium]|nr:alpha-galactosidase [Clostridia bacterium]